MDHVDVFDKSMGSLGRYQIWVTFLLMLTRFPVGWHLLNILIIDPPAEINCVSPSNFSGCDQGCLTREIDPVPFDLTIQSQWKYVCFYKFVSSLPQMLLMVGVMIGAFAFGMWADKRGRKIPVCTSCVLQAVVASAIAYVPWYWLFLVMRFLIGVATGGLITTGFVLLMELIGKRWRVVIGMISPIPTWLAHLSLAPIGYYFRDWRHSQLVISVPLILFVALFWLIPESPRYLVLSGRLDDAIAEMEMIATKNKLPTDAIAADINYYYTNHMKKVKRGKFTDLFTPRTICFRTIIMAVNFMTAGVCFYGVAQMIGKGEGNIFQNIAISASMEVPGTLAALVLVITAGRKWCLITVNVISGLPMFVIPFVAETSVVFPIMALISLFGLAGAMAVLFVYASELYPTSMRSLGVGFVGMMCRVGTVSAPLLLIIGEYDVVTWLPPIIFAVLPLIAAALVFFLPETKNDMLPDTLDDALNLGKKNPDGDENAQGSTKNK